MPNEGEIRCQYQQGVVTLTCGDEAFARLWTAVVAAVGPAVETPQDVTVVVLKRPESDRPPNRWLDAVGYLGCAIAAVTVIVLLGTGAYTVSRWLW